MRQIISLRMDAATLSAGRQAASREALTLTAFVERAVRRDLQSSSRHPADRFRDVVANCDRIARYIAGMTREGYEGDPLTADAVERCLERISEAANKLGPELDERYPDAPWNLARAVGNILRHVAHLSKAMIWESLQNELPDLRASAESELNRLESKG